MLVQCCPTHGPVHLDLFSVAVMDYLRLCKEKAYTYGWWEIEDLARTLCHMVESQKGQWAHSTRDKPIHSVGTNLALLIPFYNNIICLRSCHQAQPQWQSDSNGNFGGGKPKYYISLFYSPEIIWLAYHFDFQ